MAEWDLKKYYWPKERVERWWKQGWDWDSLQKKPCKFLGDGKTLADYYGEAFSKTILFNDPRPGKTGQISEWDYWHLDGKDRWLTEFAGKLWTPYHLPLYDLNGNLSPKHPGYDGAEKWMSTDNLAFNNELITRVKKGNKSYNAPMVGIVVSPGTGLSGDDETLHPNFSHTMWGALTDFSSLTFGDNTLFNCATFDDIVYFCGTTFGNNVNFAEVVFGNFVDFSDVNFGHKAIFSGATFKDMPIFSDTTFGDWAKFNDTKFHGYASFGAKKNAIDTSSKWSFQNISFASAEFFGDVDFTGRKFTGKTDFRGARFHGPAKFYETDMPEETYFTLDDKHWPLPPEPKGWITKKLERLRRRISSNNKSATDFEEYEKAFCRLKKIQLGHEARTAEHFFYKLELKARMRRSDIRWTEKFAAGAYGLFSDYGESIGLPLLWLFVSFLIATAVTCCAALPFWHEFAPDNLGFAATAAWHNLIPGGFIKDVFQGCHDETCRSYRYGEWSDHLLTAYGFWLYVVTGLFAAGNLALWFLFGLALKRRFQIK